LTTPQPILFTHYGEDWIRGSERCLLDLMTHIDRNRFQPILWSNNPSLAVEARALGVTTHESRFTILFDFNAPHFPLANYVRLIRQGLRLVRTHGIRLLHSNSPAPNQWLVPVARQSRRPLLVHLLAPCSERERFTLGLHQASLAVGLSQGCVEGLAAEGMAPERVRVIHSGVDTALLASGDERGLRARLGIAPHEIVLTRVGSLIHRKGVDLMLQAFAELLRVHPHCHLLVVGEGPDREQLEELARTLGIDRRVHFVGLLQPAGAVLRDATDVAVSPARSEGFGLTVIEAGALGRPVVATDTPGMREILTNEVDGLIVPVENVPALVSALARLVSDPAARNRLGSALRETVEQRFTIRRYVKEFENAYAELLERPPEEYGWSGPHTSFVSYRRWLGMAAARMIQRKRVSIQHLASGSAR
jgi:glycosyltransferase involved in cell wall biosynthesis